MFSGCLKDPLNTERLIIFTKDGRFKNSVLTFFLDGKEVGRITEVSTTNPTCASYGSKYILLSLESRTYAYEIRVNGFFLEKGKLYIEEDEKICFTLEI